MKKVVCLLSMLICLGNTFDICASGVYGYGDCIGCYMESSEIYSNVLRADSSFFSMTTDEQYDGKSSLKLNTGKLNINQTASFSTNVQGSSFYGEGILVEVFVKGIEQSTLDNSLKFDIYDSNGLLSPEAPSYDTDVKYESAKDGWNRMYVTIPYVKSTLICTVGVTFKKANNNVTDIYFDNLQVTILPVSLELPRFTEVYNGSLDLDSVQVFGTDIFGSKREINNHSLMQWSAQNGVINGNFLRPTGTEQIILTVSCWGETASAEVHINALQNDEVSYSDVICVDGEYVTNAANNSNGSKRAILLVCVYTNDCLYKAYCASSIIGAGESCVLKTQRVNIPTWLSNTSVKTFTW